MMFEKEIVLLRELHVNGLFSKPFYSIRCNKKSFESYENFKEIKFMHKQELRDTNVFERTNSCPKDIFGIFSSRGTTGNKTYYLYNKTDKIVHSECAKTYLAMLDVTENDLAGVMVPITSCVMGHAMLWQFTAVGAGYVNCESPSPDNIIDFVSNIPITIIATKPSVASSVVYSPKWAESAKNSHVNKLLLGGDFLSKGRRKLLENVWGATCFNLFGMSELFGPMASECKQRDGLHYRDDYIFIEVIDPLTNQPAQNDQKGVAVYTTLWEKGFPLLRYWSDDIVSIKSDSCACGSSLPRLYYHGRMADHIYNQGSYIFPEQVEDILIENGFIGDFKARIKNNKVDILTEATGKEFSSHMVEQLNLLFNKNVEVKLVEVNSLNSTGVGNRFENQ